MHVCVDWFHMCRMIPLNHMQLLVPLFHEQDSIPEHLSFRYCTLPMLLPRIPHTSGSFLLHYYVGNVRSSVSMAVVFYKFYSGETGRCLITMDPLCRVEEGGGDMANGK